MATHDSQNDVAMRKKMAIHTNCNATTEPYIDHGPTRKVHFVPSVAQWLRASSSNQRSPCRFPSKPATRLKRTFNSSQTKLKPKSTLSFERCLLIYDDNGLVCVESTHHFRQHRASRKYRALANDGALRFEPEPYSKKLELNSSGKIHCKVAGGVAPTVQWFLNEEDPLPEGVSSSNGTLLISEASRAHAGNYTCKASEEDKVITSKVRLDVVDITLVNARPAAFASAVPDAARQRTAKRVPSTWRTRMLPRARATGVANALPASWERIRYIMTGDREVSPRVIEPTPGEEVHVTVGNDVYLHCRAVGDPEPSIHWDRNLTVLTSALEGVDVEGSNTSVKARVLLLKNGTLVIRGAKKQDTDRYGCTAGSAAGLARNELLLTVHQEGELPAESTGVAGKAVLVSISVAAAYMVLVLALMLYCRRRRRLRRQRGEKMELEMAEGQEKLVEDGEEVKTKLNGNLAQNGRLLTAEKDSGADNSEVSAMSRASKRSGQYDHLTVSKTLLTDIITLGRGEFGDVMLGKIDVTQVRASRGHEEEVQPKIKPVLIKVLSTKEEETLLAEFRRQLEMFSRVKHENVSRLIGLCNDSEPHYMLLEHTDWGDLKQFLIATRNGDGEGATPLSPAHTALLAAHVARAGDAFARRRQTHRDIAARNCMITSKLHLKLSLPALTRGPHTHEYYKLHDQVIPLRWLPAEAVLESDYSTKSDVYMFAATVWEVTLLSVCIMSRTALALSQKDIPTQVIYTKAELPFAKLNDNSVMERTKAGSLEWSAPPGVPGRLAALLAGALAQCRSGAASYRRRRHNDDIRQRRTGTPTHRASRVKLKAHRSICRDRDLSMSVSETRPGATEAPPLLKGTRNKKCWSKSPTERPLFDVICDEMKEVLKEVTSENVVEIQDSKEEIEKA
ncbi:Inactive tyrosine-protein kinase 7 [Eumeta japonica]|uniref:Inactive tyrosine-protein kinase 7 n=1 Tax=Eumeta variegata TaxID=151549 RepID=A0A4C1UTM4_EUMVA|nr:Inactive tyrosine-protein kinase 7 [Eumeta japonica]